MNGLPPIPLPTEGGDGRFLALHARSHVYAAPALGAARRASASLFRTTSEPAPPPGRPEPVAGYHLEAAQSAAEQPSPLSLGRATGFGEHCSPPVERRSEAKAPGFRDKPS